MCLRPLFLVFIDVAVSFTVEFLRVIIDLCTWLISKLLIQLNAIIIFNIITGLALRVGFKINTEKFFIHASQPKLINKVSKIVV